MDLTYDDDLICVDVKPEHPHNLHDEFTMQNLEAILQYTAEDNKSAIPTQMERGGNYNAPGGSGEPLPKRRKEQYEIVSTTPLSPSFATSSSATDNVPAQPPRNPLRKRLGPKRFRNRGMNRPFAFPRPATEDARFSSQFTVLTNVELHNILTRLTAVETELFDVKRQLALVRHQRWVPPPQHHLQSVPVISEVPSDTGMVDLSTDYFFDKALLFLNFDDFYCKPEMEGLRSFHVYQLLDIATRKRRPISKEGENSFFKELTMIGNTFAQLVVAPDSGIWYFGETKGKKVGDEGTRFPESVVTFSVHGLLTAIRSYGGHEVDQSSLFTTVRQQIVDSVRNQRKGNKCCQPLPAEKFAAEWKILNAAIERNLLINN